MGSQAVSLDIIVKSPDEDAQLVKNALKGNSDAFKELFVKNVSKIYSLCFRISADAYIAEELTQEVFIKAWEKLTSFKFESRFSSWLHSIAVNQFLMHIRSEKKYSERIDELKSEMKNTFVGQRQDSQIDLEKAIGKLPEQSRTVLILHDIEGYKHNEISEMMNIQPGTSKAHLHRARKLLREELSK